MDTRSTDIAPVVKAWCAAGLLSAGLALAPSAWAQEEERWVFGGAGGETWRAHVDLNVMAVFVGSQGPITDDFDNWSPWSGPLAESGSRPGLASGRWFAVQIEMRSGSPSDFARLDSLSIEIIPLLADRVVAEVAKAGDGLSPLASEVPLGEEVELSYAISAEFEEIEGGFDAVHIGTPSRPTFRGLRIGTPLDEVAPDSVALDEKGLTVYLPGRIEADEDLRIGLGTVLYTVAAELDGIVFNRAEPGRGQPVIGGDATGEIASNSLQLLSSGNELERTISGVDIRPRAITPNGDGFNDLMEIGFALFGVLETDVEIVFYDLGGNAVSRIMGTSAGPGTKRARMGRNGRGGEGAHTGSVPVRSRRRDR